MNLWVVNFEHKFWECSSAPPQIIQLRWVDIVNSGFFLQIIVQVAEVAWQCRKAQEKLFIFWT